MKKLLTIFLTLVILSCKEKETGFDDTSGMVFINGSTYFMGGNDQEANPDELPVHEVKVNSFWIDETEVTNEEFSAFVDATGYVTTAEIKPDWEEIKKDLPPNTPKPDESVFVPASLAGFLQFLAIDYHLSNMSRGVIDSRNLIYFFSIIGFFLFLTVQTLEVRRWK